MTIYHTQHDVATTVSSADEPEGLEGRRSMSEDDNWRDGRLVLPRPEARNSVIAKSYIEQTPEMAKEYAQALYETVISERQVTPQQRALDFQALAAKANLSGS